MITNGLITCTDATIADVERAIRDWHAAKAAADRAAEVARLEAPALAQWEAMTPHPKQQDVRCDAFGVAWKFRTSPWRRFRELSPVGFAPGARVRVSGGRVAHVAGFGMEWCNRCGAYIARGVTAGEGLPLCRAHRGKA